MSIRRRHPLRYFLESLEGQTARAFETYIETPPRLYPHSGWRLRTGFSVEKDLRVFGL